MCKYLGKPGWLEALEEQEELEEMYLDETSENDCPVPEPGEGEIELWLEEA